MASRDKGLTFTYNTEPLLKRKVSVRLNIMPPELPLSQSERDKFTELYETWDLSDATYLLAQAIYLRACPKRPGVSVDGIKTDLKMLVYVSAMIASKFTEDERRLQCSEYGDAKSIDVMSTELKVLRSIGWDITAIYSEVERFVPPSKDDTSRAISVDHSVRGSDIPDTDIRM